MLLLLLVVFGVETFVGTAADVAAGVADVAVFL